MPLRPCLALALALSAAVHPAAAADTRPLTVVTVNFPPYVQLEHDKAEGILVRRFSKALEAAGYSAHRWDLLPPTRVTAYVAEGQADVALIAKIGQHDERTVVDYERPVLVVTLQAMAVDRAPPIRSHEDLRGRTVITQYGYGYAGLTDYMAKPDNGVTIALRAPTTELALRALFAHRGEILLHYPDVVGAVAEPEQAARLKGTTLRQTAINMVVNAARPDARDMLRRVLDAYHGERRGEAWVGPRTSGG